LVKALTVQAVPLTLQEQQEAADLGSPTVAVAVVAVVVLAPVVVQAVAELFAFFGPATRVLTHQQIQEICNGIVYSD
jgi:hypothetical protein